MSSDNAEQAIGFVDQDHYERDILLNDLKVILDSRESDSFQFKCRAKNAQSLQNRFLKVQSKIEKKLIQKGEFNQEIQIGIRNEFNELYYNILGKVSRLNDQEQESRRISQFNSTLQTPSFQSNMRLPNLPLPEFSGDVTDFPSYYALFKSLVHENNMYSNAEKFRYLLLTLKGEPLGLIKSIPITDENYPNALKIIVSRYQNVRVIATKHLDSILEIENVTDRASSTGVRHLLNVFQENSTALEMMDFPVEQWSFILLNILLKKLSPTLRRRFEQSLVNPTIIPDVSDLIQFLQREIFVNDLSGSESKCGASEGLQKSYSIHKNSKITSQNKKVFLVKEQVVESCVSCNSNHSLTKCPKFLVMSIEKRHNLIKSNNLCYNCLKGCHVLKNCKSSYSCQVCHKRHHTLIHFSNKGDNVCGVVSSAQRPTSGSAEVPLPLPPLNKHSLVDNTQSSAPSQCSGLKSLNSKVHKSQTVLLSTALVDVHVNAFSKHTLRCIVDSGSQASFITEACVQRLGLSRQKSDTIINGIGDSKNLKSKGQVTCLITPKHSPEPRISVNAFILNKIVSAMPSVDLPKVLWPHLCDVKLADEEFYCSKPIDMLLGCDIMSMVLLGGDILKGPPGTPSALNSVFGYLLFGNISLDSTQVASYVTSEFSACHVSLEEVDLCRFWELDAFPETCQPSVEDIHCEKLYTDTVSRNASGRYCVALPFQSDVSPLGLSRDTALTRLQKLERRLERNSDLKMEYNKVMQEYLDLGHMQLTDPNESESSYYIPHHCVVRESSVSTKVRVVFDASCSTSNGNSLNSNLYVGPKLHQDIVKMLLKFRMHPIVLTADIKQMYRQIEMRDQDRDYQRVLWRFSPSDAVRDYRLTTVTFGVSSSPFLAQRTIRQLAQDERAKYPRAARVLEEDVFMDDIVTGAEDEIAASQLKRELQGLCEAGCFELHKWNSNCPSLLFSKPSLKNDLQGERQEKVVFSEPQNTESASKLLGLIWNPNSDRFSFDIKYSPRVCTKRVILSEIARIYDPLGWLAPVTLFAKVIIQRLWLAGLGWDDTPPKDIALCWEKFTTELNLLTQISLPRYVFQLKAEIQIHGFSDASETGYGACVYLRSVNANGEIKTYLILSKTKVAPLKRVSIPRLELSGAVLLAKLLELVIKVYDVSVEKVFAWTDSTIVLAWLKSSPHEWKTFVSNRVTEVISRVPPSRWRHVPTAENPADLASRGSLPSGLVSNTQWFSGPPWLSVAEDNWPNHCDVKTTDLEKRKIVLVSTQQSEVFNSKIIDSLLDRFSNLRKIVRVLAFVYRFYNKCRKVERSKSAFITVPEYNNCLKKIVKSVQHSVFGEDIKNLVQGKVLSDRLQRLKPFLDEDGLLRVGGRIERSLIDYENKHPIVLPKRHVFTDLLIDDAHVTYMHVGPQTLQYLLTHRYWILSARDIIRQRVHKCIRCFRAKPKSPQPLMAPLPAVRVRPERPFLKVGVDYAGPFNTRANIIRNAKIYKSYVAVFICMVTKAVHLELVSDLTTESMLAALRRFISRRGLCTDIFSDCGKNFVGCNSYLKELCTFLNDSTNQKVIFEHALRLEITWHFIPAYAPHFGGLWENYGVKGFKQHWYRVIGNQTLTYDEFNTLLCQVEAVLNSRPLCLLSSDPSDPLPLTPAHFLVGGPLTTLPDVSLVDQNPSRLTRWRLVQQCLQHFWKRWSREYLQQLQQRGKWLRDKSDVQLGVGSVVLVREDNTSPLKWCLGRIEALHPGADGITRAVSVRIGKTISKRPVVKICPLPLE